MFEKQDIIVVERHFNEEEARCRSIPVKNHITVVGKYSSEHAQYCDREGPVLMHDIVVEKYSGEEARYCGGEDLVLMTKVRGMETSEYRYTVLWWRGIRVEKHSIVVEKAQY